MSKIFVFLFVVFMLVFSKTSFAIFSPEDTLDLEGGSSTILQSFPKLRDFCREKRITQFKTVGHAEGYDGHQQRGMYIFGNGSPLYFGKIIPKDEQYDRESYRYRMLEEKIKEFPELGSILTIPIIDVHHVTEDLVLQVMPFSGEVHLIGYFEKNIITPDWDKNRQDVFFREDKKAEFFEILHQVGAGFGLLSAHDINPSDSTGRVCNDGCFRLKEGEDGYVFRFVDCGSFSTSKKQNLDAVLYLFARLDMNYTDFILLHEIESFFTYMREFWGKEIDKKLWRNMLYGFNSGDADADEEISPVNLTVLAKLYIDRDERNRPVTTQLMAVSSWSPWLTHLLVGFKKACPQLTEKLIEELKVRQKEVKRSIYPLRIKDIRYNAWLWTRCFFEQSLDEAIKALETDSVN